MNKQLVKQDGKQLVSPEDGEKLRNLKDLITQAAPKLAGVLPKHVRLERLITIANAALTRTPKLQECTSTSVLLGIMRGAELGLEVGNGLNHASLVPFFNGKTNRMEATFIPGYKGLMLLASNYENILFDAQAVFSNDTFEVHTGTRREIVHRPTLRTDRGELVAVYAIAFFPDGRYIFDLMTTDEVDSIRARAKSKDSGPWVTDYNAMALKTVIRRLCWRKLNLKAESPLAKAVAFDQDENPDYADEVSEIIKSAERQSAQSPKRQLVDRISQKVNGNAAENRSNSPQEHAEKEDNVPHDDEKTNAQRASDEAAGQENGPKEDGSTNGKITDAQASKIYEMVDEGWNQKSFAAWMKGVHQIDRIEDLPVARYEKFIASLKKQIAGSGKK